MATNNNVKKNMQGYGYKYTDLAAINDFLHSQGIGYSQYVETSEVNGEDYIYTVPVVEGVAQPPRRGCMIPKATLSGKSNPAQEYGSALTYARRYSLLLAFGLATEDDDAESLTRKEADAPILITDNQKTKLFKELERTGISETAVLDRYKKTNVDELTNDEFRKIMVALSKSVTKETK